MIQGILAIWSLVPLLFLNSGWISGSSCTVRVLLNPGFENFEHYFTSLWDECNCAVVWAFFDIAFLWDWNENYSFSSPVSCRGPAWGTLPMAKVMRKEAWHTQRHDQASGNPLFPSIYPQNQSLSTLLFHALASGGLFPTSSLGEGVNVQLQVNKNSWAWQECFSLWTPLKVI